MTPPPEAEAATIATAGTTEVPGLVTTVVTSYNKGPWLAEAIDSALAQDYPLQEILVVDDDSTDDTAEVARSYGDRVRYIHQENRGCPGSKNTGIREARGELVAFLDGDDRWRPSKLSKQVELFGKDPEVGVVYSGRIVFDSEKTLQETPWGGRVPYRGWVLDEMLTDNVVPVSAAVARRRCLLAVGMLNEAQRVASDFDLWLRMAKEYRFDYVDEALLEYRVGIESIGSQVGNKFAQTSEIQERFLREHFAGRYPRPRVVARATATRLDVLGDYHLAHGRQGKAAAAYLRALGLDPASPGRLRRLARAMIPNPLAARLKGLAGSAGAAR